MDLKQASLLELTKAIEDEGFYSSDGERLPFFRPWVELVARCKNLELLLDNLLESPSVEAALDNFEKVKIKGE